MEGRERSCEGENANVSEVNEQSLTVTNGFRFNLGIVVRSFGFVVVTRSRVHVNCKGCDKSFLSAQFGDSIHTVCDNRWEKF